jgi:putative aldouronate transport system substrate-binding protein
MRGRFLGNYGNFFGRYGPNSIRGLSNFLKDNNMLLLDAFFGPPTEAMQLYYAGLQDDFNILAVNIIVGNLPITAFDTFVSDWHRDGGQQITDDVNAWFTTIG